MCSSKLRWCRWASFQEAWPQEFHQPTVSGLDKLCLWRSQKFHSKKLIKVVLAVFSYWYVCQLQAICYCEGWSNTFRTLVHDNHVVFIVFCIMFSFFMIKWTSNFKDLSTSYFITSRLITANNTVFEKTLGSTRLIDLRLHVA